jgi:hypothetical protein
LTFITSMARLTCYYLRSWLLIQVACLANAQAVPPKDVLETSSKGQIHGKFKKANSEVVVFEIEPGVEISAPWKAGLTVTVGGPVLVQGLRVNDGHAQTLENITMSCDDHGDLTITGINQPVRLVDLRLIAPAPRITTNIHQESAATVNPGNQAIWYASLTPKFSLTSGTQSVQTIGGAAVLRRAQNVSSDNWHHEETTLTLDATNTLTEQVGSPSIRTHEYDGALSDIIYLTNGVYAEALAEGFHNSSFNLYLQQSYGGGIGKKFSGKRASLELGGGLLYIAEHFVNSAGPSFVGARLSERVSLQGPQLNGGRIQIIEATSFIPAIDESKAWQIRGTAQLVIPITKALSFTAGFIEDYMENAPNARKSYSTTTVGINFNLGQQ